MSDCSSEARCNGLLLDEEEFRFGVLVDRSIRIDAIEGLEEESLRRFDNDQSRDEATKGVLNL
jgi:hypothetical protein